MKMAGGGGSQQQHAIVLLTELRQSSERSDIAVGDPSSLVVTRQAHRNPMDGDMFGIRCRRLGRFAE
ncbi:hypothetical protein [Phytohalomonas tamaricis]|uniref:hypothetical protein n=1 Tax=Phytohalomonas tamaricis TaxID=2081032 RepID=UPI00374E1574